MRKNKHTGSDDVSEFSTNFSTRIKKIDFPAEQDKTPWP